MLLALLYCEPDRVAAAAFACDQIPNGNQYWTEIFEGEIESGSEYETSYMTVTNSQLRERLLKLGIYDEWKGVELDGRELAKALEDSVAPALVAHRAA